MKYRFFSSGVILLLSLQDIRLVLLHSSYAAPLKLAIVNDVVGCGSQHGLDVIVAIAHDKSPSVAALAGGPHLLDLQALHHRDGKELRRLVGIVKDGTAAGSVESGIEEEQKWTSQLT